MTIQEYPGSMMDNGGGMSCLPCTPDEEKQIVRHLVEQSELDLKEDNLFFLISARWYKSWERYVGVDADVNGDRIDFDGVDGGTSVQRPGPIDNSDLIETNGNGDDVELRRNLEEVQDYVLVPQQVWEKLFHWYKGGPLLPRKVICEGIVNEKRVEVYPLSLKLIDSRDNSQSTIKLSKKASLRELYEKVCAVKGIELGKARIWDYFNKQKSDSPLDVSNQTLEDATLQMDQDILLEMQVDDGWSAQCSMDSTGNEFALVPLEPSRSTMTIAGGPTTSNGHSTSYSSNRYQGSVFNSSFADMDDGYDAQNSLKKVESGGLAGLQNLGNTCFMNSSLQCLVHTPCLAEYFLKDYSDEINTDNPLGMHGELALAFGDLLRKLWSSGKTAVAPRVFKGKLARFAPQFSGYNQHDSQELLAFLLDGLHEDLNRVKRKPYIEMKDSDGRPDDEVANECWKNHKARNDSLIVDTFQGQYKSTLVCPDCNKISITFDPFMYLTLPLPSTVTRSMTVTVFYADGSNLPMPYTVTVMKHGCCKDLLAALGTACCLTSDESLLLAEVYNHSIFKYFDNPAEMLTSIKDDEHIVAYRFDRKGAGKIKLEVVHRWLDKSATDYLKSGETKLFGAPLVTYLEEEQLSGVDVDKAVARLLAPLRRMCSPPKVNKPDENGYLSDATDRPSNSCNHSLESGELEDEPSKELSFQLSLTDNRITTCKPLKKDSQIKPISRVKVVLDWNDAVHESYDSSYLKDLPVVHKTGFTVKKTRQEAISLFSCLDAFLTEEPLGPDDMWYCPRCKEHRQATKKLDLWMLPEILVFHLKRFSYSRYMKNKLDTFVNFPIHNLDLSKYMKNKSDEPYIYELYAISNHYGGLGGGHYTAYAKLINENRWYHFDDSHVSLVSEAEIKTAAAYVLFYKRVKRGESNMDMAETSADNSC